MATPELPDDDVPVLRHWGESTTTTPVAAAGVPERKHAHKWGPFDFLNDDRTCACGASKADVDKARHAGKHEAAKK